MAVLEASGLIKTVGSGRAARRLLDGVTLSVDGGEVVAVLGRSGSGAAAIADRVLFLSDGRLAAAERQW